jgi:hypothetical protein
MSETFKESGAIVYVAITIIVFVFFVLVAVWIMTRKKNNTYSFVDNVELVNNSENSAKNVVNNSDEANSDEAKINNFTLEDSEEEEDIDLYSDKLEDQLQAV